MTETFPCLEFGKLSFGFGLAFGTRQESAIIRELEMFTFLTFIFLISLLAFVHELGHFLAAKILGVKVEEFGLGFPPRILGRTVGETQYSINLLPVGGFVRLFGEGSGDGDCTSPRAFCGQSYLRQAVIIVGGVVMNLILGLFLFGVVFTVFGSPCLRYSAAIQEVVEGAPAASSGLKGGDEIVAVKVGAESDFNYLETPDELGEFIKENLDQKVVLLVKREETAALEEMAVELESGFDSSKGALGIVYVSMPYVSYQRIGFRAVPKAIASQVAEMVKMIFKNLIYTFSQFFRGRKAPLDIAGPVGIARISGQIARQGWRDFLHFVGTLSISLAVFNFLPLPALDGGRLALIIFEGISRCRVKAQWQQRIQIAGFVFLLVLMGWVTFWDIARMF
ncbi:hypothetical protein B5M47_02155 [candidate division CPR3 bacterium 4484_211]|uniref:Peptidase M50 domain-containing protein n=1 Tax=candidate division CPR3 bacterium 4484_211 TaxID=1968527 RepID=A0A1W9NY55_UNCC3|nr:MAG: hypothetical protein B5M47_02155 [candidate division CPR3 bacterium 4484_211]